MSVVLAGGVCGGCSSSESSLDPSQYEELDQAEEIAPEDIYFKELRDAMNLRESDRLFRWGEEYEIVVRLRVGEGPHLFTNSCDVLEAADLGEGWEGTCIEDVTFPSTTTTVPTGPAGEFTSCMGREGYQVTDVEMGEDSEGRPTLSFRVVGTEPPEDVIRRCRGDDRPGGSTSDMAREFAECMEEAGYDVFDVEIRPDPATGDEVVAGFGTESPEVSVDVMQRCGFAG